jgi:hypothetical protein
MRPFDVPDIARSPLTRITEFQLLHTPAAFQAERIAWRFVVYLNLIRSVRRCVPDMTPTPI